MKCVHRPEQLGYGGCAEQIQIAGIRMRLCVAIGEDDGQLIPGAPETGNAVTAQVRADREMPTSLAMRSLPLHEQPEDQGGDRNYDERRGGVIAQEDQQDDTDDKDGEADIADAADAPVSLVGPLGEFGSALCVEVVHVCVTLRSEAWLANAV